MRKCLWRDQRRKQRCETGKWILAEKKVPSSQVPASIVMYKSVSLHCEKNHVSAAKLCYIVVLYDTYSAECQHVRAGKCHINKYGPGLAPTALAIACPRDPPTQGHKMPTGLPEGQGIPIVPLGMCAPPTHPHRAYCRIPCLQTDPGPSP